MSENNQPLVINNQSFKTEYDSKCIEWRSQPVQNRKCNDVICVVIFFIILAAFMVVGIFYISDYNGLPFDAAANRLFIKQYGQQIAACSSISLGLSLLYIILIRIMPKVMVYFLIGFTLAVFLGLAIIGLIIDNLALTISFGIIFIVYGIVLICFRKQIDTGIVLIKVAAMFMTQKWGVFISPIIKIFLNIALAFFWIYSVSCIIAVGQNKKDTGKDAFIQDVLGVVWVLFWLFFNFLFYYMMVYTVAIACSFWYYDVKDKNYLTTAYKWLLTSSFGSVVFAALLISIITLARMIISSRRGKKTNIAVAVCLCIIQCCLRSIQNLLSILNHNAVIVMAVTGESYFESAKTTIGILSRFFPLMKVTQIINSLIIFWGVVIISGISGIIGYYWLKTKLEGSDLTLIVTIVIMASLMTSILVLSVLVESVSSVFIFYCFDVRFKELGYSSNNMPAEIYSSLGLLNYKDR